MKARTNEKSPETKQRKRGKWKGAWGKKGMCSERKMKKAIPNSAPARPPKLERGAVKGRKPLEHRKLSLTARKWEWATANPSGRSRKRLINVQKKKGWQMGAKGKSDNV